MHAVDRVTVSVVGEDTLSRHVIALDRGTVARYDTCPRHHV